MKIGDTKLFKTQKEFFLFLGFSAIVFFYTTLIQYNNFKNLTRFDTAIVEVSVLKQYLKTKQIKNKIKTYQVLKVKSFDGFSFYITKSKNFPPALDKILKLEIDTKRITFYKYLTGFYSYSKLFSINQANSLKQYLNKYISKIHKDKDITQLYQALYTASPLSKNLQTIFSNMGISHLLAISGFHLGVLSAILFFLFKYPYKFLQSRYFPYRSYKIDSFVVISTLLLGYLIVLDFPASLLRSYAMLLIGFILYDRGIEVVSMQTLFLSVIILISLFPRILFSLGFWFSVSGVFYIFLFLINFKELKKILQFILLPFWIYLMMLPFSLVIFSNFSIYHPLSILWSILFTFFYPLTIFLHLIGYGDILDGLLKIFINYSPLSNGVFLNYKFLVIEILFSILAIFKKTAMWFLLFYIFGIFIYAMIKV